MSNETQPSVGKPRSSDGKRSLVQRGLDAIFGYDFFISYTRRDGGKDYAEKLARRLEAAGFQIFFDSDDYAMGDDWKVEGKWALKRTSQLILVASPEALSSSAVVREVEVYSSLPNRRIIPIDFGGTIRDRDESKPIFKHLKPEILFIEENPDCLGAEPSDFVVQKLQDGFNLKRQDKKRSRIFSIVAAVLVVLTIAASVMAVIARIEQLKALANLRRSRFEEAKAWLERARAYDGSKNQFAAAMMAAKGLGFEEVGRPKDDRQFDQQHPVLLETGEQEHRELRSQLRSVLMRNAFAPKPVWSASIPDYVTHLAFSPDGKRLVCATTDGTIDLWDMASSTRRTTRSLLESPSPDASAEEKEMALMLRSGFVAVSRDAKTLARGSYDRDSLVNMTLKQSLRLWDVDSGSEKAVLTQSLDNLTALAFSPDGKTLASGSLDSEGPDWTIQLWDVASTRKRGLSGHGQPVNCLAFSPDGKTLASGSADETIKLWDLISGSDKATATLEQEAPDEKRESVKSLAFSPDGATLACGKRSGGILLWDMADKTQRELSGHDPIAGTDSAVQTFALAFSPDSQTLASGSDDKTVKLWDVASGLEQATLSGHEKGVVSVAFGPDGRTLASASEDNTVKLWDLTGSFPSATLSGHGAAVKSVAFSPDGMTLASGSDDKTVKLWDVPRASEKLTLKGHEGWVRDVAFSQDGKTLASGSQDGTIKLWDWAGESQESPLTLEGNKYIPVSSVTFGRKGGEVLASGSLESDESFNGVIRLWRLAGEWREFRSLKGHSKPVSSLAFSPNGQTLASGSYDSTIRLWDLPSGSGEFRPLEGHESAVWSVAFSPDGSKLASGGYGPRQDTAAVPEAIKLWHVASGAKKGGLRGHTERVTSVVFVGTDGQTLASGSYDKTVKLWDLENETEKATLMGHAGPVLCVALSPDGRILASGSEDSTIKLWRVPTAQMDLADYLLKGYLNLDGRNLRWGSKVEGMVNVPPSSHLAILQQALPAKTRDLALLRHYLEARNWSSVQVMLGQLKDNTAVREELQLAERDIKLSAGYLQWLKSISGPVREQSLPSPEERMTANPTGIPF